MNHFSQSQSGQGEGEGVVVVVENGREEGEIDDMEVDLVDQVEEVNLSPISPSPIKIFRTGRSKWIFTPEELGKTPSMCRGMSPEDELTIRRIGVKLIYQIHEQIQYRFPTASAHSQPPPRIVCSGAVFFHRFYMFHPFQIFHPFEIATICYFLASKTEEKPRTCEDVTRTALVLLAGHKTGTLYDEGMKAYEDIRKSQWTLESILIQTLNFEHIIEHPFTRHTEICISSFKSAETVKRLKSRLNYVMSESLVTTVCLQWDARTIAVAFVILACNKERIPLREWETLIIHPDSFEFKSFSVTRETVGKIHHTLATAKSTSSEFSDADICTKIFKCSGETAANKRDHIIAED